MDPSLAPLYLAAQEVKKAAAQYNDDDDVDITYLTAVVRTFEDEWRDLRDNLLASLSETERELVEDIVSIL